MHQYLHKIRVLPLISACLLWGILSAADVSIENYPKLTDYSSESGNAARKSTLQERQHQAPAASLISSFGKLFSELCTNSSNKDNPTHECLNIVQHHADFCAYALYLIKPTIEAYFIKKRSIYLLDRSFLI